MGSPTKKTNTRRRMKVARKAILRSRKSNKTLRDLQSKGFNKPLSL